MAAGSGLTAAADASLTRTIVGVTTSAYVTPTNNYVALYNTQFTNTTKAGATEFTTTGYSTYARQAMGATGTGWTIAAYSSSVPGVVFTNTNTVTFPQVPTGGAAQTLFSVGFCDASTAGNIDFFADLLSSQTVNVNVSVVFTASTGISFTTY